MKNTNNTPKILANATVIKLREYSQSYGAPETVKCAFIKEFQNEIWMCNEEGWHIRTLRKGTKKLISFQGKEITERAFKMRTNKAKEELRLKNIEQQRLAEIENAEKAAKDLELMIPLSSYFTGSKISEIKEKLFRKNSNECKNYYKIKSIQLTGNYKNWKLVRYFISK